MASVRSVRSGDARLERFLARRKRRRISFERATTRAHEPNVTFFSCLIPEPANRFLIQHASLFPSP